MVARDKGKGKAVEEDKGKGKYVHQRSPSKKRKSLEVIDSGDSGGRGKRQKSSSTDSPTGSLGSSTTKASKTFAPEDQTAVEGRLGPQNPYLIADRLHKVAKIRDENPFFKRYEQDEFGKLGRGSFGSVCKFTDKKYNKTYAVKIVDKDDIYVETPGAYFKLGLYTEAACFTKILPKHRHIINVARIVESPRYLFYVMECLAKFDLKQSFRSFTDAQARRCFYRILQAVDHLHQHGIVHCDLKMENICVRQDDKTYPVIIDFGCCHYSDRLVRKKLDDFNEEEVFTERELTVMRWADTYEDCQELANILEMLLTGEPTTFNYRTPNRDRYLPKAGTHPDAVALLEFMQNKISMSNSTVEQLLEHPWFDPERSVG